MTKNLERPEGRLSMRKLIIGILTFVLILGTGAIMKSTFGKDRGYGSQYDRFGSWDSDQRDRLGSVYRNHLITAYDYDRLNQELSNIETYHDQAFSKGFITEKEDRRLGKMEGRLSNDIEKSLKHH